LVEPKLKKRRRQKAEYSRRVYYSPEGRAKQIHKSAKRRALHKGLAFSITEEWVAKQIAQQEGCCAMTGIPFIYEQDKRYKRHPFSPSLDRVNNSRGYTVKNTRVVCTMYNYCKNTAFDEDVEYFAWQLFHHKYRRGED
jgi:hypothetical protein